MVSLTYIWHDCFLFEDERLAIVFDFWRDPMRDLGNLVKEGKKREWDEGNEGNSLPGFLRGIDRKKPLYVIVSHHHKDHYVKEIFDWCRDFTNLRYIISKDTAKFAKHIISPTSIYNGIKPDPDIVTTLKPGDSYTDANLTVEAFGSTDIGNSYALTIGGLKLFHAGDLNAWIWKDESTQAEVKAAINGFKNILDTISQKYPRFDIAMFPVDSRIGTDFFTGAYMFVREIDVAHFFPMHFGLGTPEEQMKYQLDAAAVENYANPERGEYICLQAPYSKFAMP